MDNTIFSKGTASRHIFFISMIISIHMVCFASCRSNGPTKEKGIAPIERTTPSSTPLSTKLFQSTIEVLEDANVEASLIDHEARVVISKWHLYDDKLRHRFIIRVIPTISPSGNENVSLFVRSQYQSLVQLEQKGDTTFLWKDASDRSLMHRSKKDEAALNQRIQARFRANQSSHRIFETP